MTDGFYRYYKETIPLQIFLVFSIISLKFGLLNFNTLFL